MVEVSPEEVAFKPSLKGWVGFQLERMDAIHMPDDWNSMAKAVKGESTGVERGSTQLSVLEPREVSWEGLMWPAVESVKRWSIPLLSVCALESHLKMRSSSAPEQLARPDRVIIL